MGAWREEDQPPSADQKEYHQRAAPVSRPFSRGQNSTHRGHSKSRKMKTLQQSPLLVPFRWHWPSVILTDGSPGVGTISPAETAMGAALSQ